MLLIVSGVNGVGGVVAVSVQARRIGTAPLSLKPKMEENLAPMDLQRKPRDVTLEDATLHLSALGVCGKHGQVVPQSVAQAGAHASANSRQA